MNFEEAKADNSLGGNADGFLLDAIQCLLVGLDKEGLALLEKALAWLEAAIHAKEIRLRHIPFITEAERSYDLAQCRWLLGKEGVQEALTGCMENLEAYYARSPRWEEYDELYLAVCIETGAYTKGIRFWEAAPGATEFGHSEVPQPVGQLAYTICRTLATAGSGEGRDSLWEVIRRVLEHNVPAWLRDGQYPTAAQWMKIAYCQLREPPLPPKEALLQCYAFLPGLETNMGPQLELT